MNAAAGLPRPAPEASSSPLFASLAGRPVRSRHPACASAIAVAVVVIAGVVMALFLLWLWLVEPASISFYLRMRTDGHAPWGGRA